MGMGVGGGWGWEVRAKSLEHHNMRRPTSPMTLPGVGARGLQCDCQGVMDAALSFLFACVLPRDEGLAPRLGGRSLGAHGGHIAPR